MKRKFSYLGGCFFTLSLACGADKPPPQPQPQPTAVPEPEPEPELEAEGGAGGAEGAGGAAAEVEKPVEKPKPSGRPAILMGPSDKIASTFGATPGAVLKLKSSGKGPITLKIPEFALPTGYNIEFSVLKKDPPKKGPLLGEVARLQLIRGEKTEPSAVPTKGEDYELRWPLYDKPTVNLAVGTAALDPKGAETGKIDWQIIAPKSVDEGFGQAYFYLGTIGPVMYLHATTAEPTPAPEG